MSTVVVQTPQKKGPGCLVSLLWFVFIGWWVSGLAIILAYLCMVTIVGIPLGVAIINKLPKLVALREPGEKGLQVTVTQGVTVVGEARVEQRNIILRAIYFLLVGFWLSAIVMVLAWGFCLTIIGMPVGFWLFDRVPAVLSLHKN